MTDALTMHSAQFFKTNFEKLPMRFYTRNKHIMPAEELTEAFKALQKLLEDVKKMENMNKHEAMKNTFLGGMRDGESWGLRKWLSKHGGALSICNDIELIWGALRILDKTDPKVIEIAKRLRPRMKKSLDRLKADVPKAYQEVSSAHPYLPFFHRLESALKGLSEFDPEDDDVICLDDTDDEEEVKPVAKAKNSLFDMDEEDGLKKPVAKSKHFAIAKTTETSSYKNFPVSDDDDDDDSDIEVVGVIAGKAEDSDDSKQEQDFLSTGGLDFDLDSTQPKWRCETCTYENEESSLACMMCDYVRPAPPKAAEGTKSKYRILLPNFQVELANSQELAEVIDHIANSLEEGRETRPSDCINSSDFWSTPTVNYVFLLRLFRDMILYNASRYMLDKTSVDPDEAKYRSIIKNPLGFRDIVKALIEIDPMKGPGKLPNELLSKWNMFEGRWLIQGMDLVMLNTLAFIGKQTSPLRKEIMGMRKSFWKSLKEAGCPDKKQMPPRRTENSDFLLHRKK